MLRRRFKPQLRSGPKLPRDGLLFWSRDGVTDNIGLSTADYDRVPPLLRHLFFSAPDTMYPLATILTNIAASDRLNENHLIGNASTNTYALYAKDTDDAVIRRGYRALRQTYTELPSLSDKPWMWSAWKNPTTSVQGPSIVTSVAAPTVQPDGSLDSAMAIFGDDGLYVPPQFQNLFTGGPTGAEAVVLTAQKYCLQVWGGSVSCSYGTATDGTPLVFTATDGSTTFTPSGATRWMLSADGGYVFEYTAPGTTSASTAATSGNNGARVPMSDAIKEALEGKRNGVELNPYPQYGGTLTPAGTDPPTVNVDTVFDGERCKVITFPIIAGGGYGVSRAEALGDGSFNIFSGARYKSIYRVALSRQLSPSERIIVYFTGSLGICYLSISSSTPVSWTEHSPLIDTSTVNGVNYFVIYAETALDSPVSIYVSLASIQAVENAVSTTIAVANMGASSAEITGPQNLTTCNNSAAGLLYLDAGGTIKCSDGTNTASVTVAGGWERDERIVATPQVLPGGTQMMIGYIKPGMSAITWGTAVPYKGTFDPLTNFRFGHTITAPEYFQTVCVLDGQSSEKECLTIAGRYLR